MRQDFFGIAAFVTAFVVGLYVALAWQKILTQGNQFNPAEIAAIENDHVTLPSLISDINAEFDPNIDYAKALKVKLIRTGDFHSFEVPYRSGEKWLGLFRVNDSYQLKETTLRITHRTDDEGLFDTNISTSDESDAVFLLRGATSLEPGKIDTEFDSEFDENNFRDLTDGQMKGFGLRGDFWHLRVENLDPLASTNGTSLVLDYHGERQLLRYLENGCDDCSWSVEWVGDLNRDGNLDFLIDLSTHYNISQPTLFVSTSDGDKIVKVFAGYHTIGC